MTGRWHNLRPGPDPAEARRLEMRIGLAVIRCLWRAAWRRPGVVVAWLAFISAYLFVCGVIGLALL